MIYSSPFVNAACAILILGGLAALVICSPWIGLGVLADRAERRRGSQVLKGPCATEAKLLNN